MIEDLKSLIDVVGNMDNGPLYLIIAFVGYKLITYLTFYSVILVIFRLIITNTFTWAMTKKNEETTVHVILDHKLLSKEKSSVYLFEAFDLADDSLLKAKWVDTSTCQYILEAVKEKRKREKEQNK